MIEVALAQYQPKVGDKKYNFNLIENAVRKTTADFIVFGELFLTGYSTTDAILNLAEPLDGRFSKKLLRLAEDAGTDIIVGLPECSENKGICYNSAVVYHQNGSISVYRKVQLANFGPFEEKLFFKPGAQLNIIKLKKAKIGLLICYDIFFPELAKIYALKGADIIVCISASPTATRKFFEKVIVARAIENATFLIYTNLVGLQGSLTFWGGSTIIDPRGDTVAMADAYKQKLIAAEINLSYLKVVRHFRPTIRDTNLEFLKMLNEIERSEVSEKRKVV